MVSAQVTTLRVIVSTTGEFEHGRPLLIERPDDVALRDNPGDAAVRARDDKRADVPLRQEPHRSRECRGRIDGEHLASLA